MSQIWLNNRFVEAREAKMPVTDRGFQYGDGVFETMRAYAGVVFGLEAHTARLSRACRTLRIPLPYRRKRLAGIVRRALTVNGLASAYIRVAVTRGEGRFGIAHADRFRPNLVVTAKEFEGYPAWMHSRGITAFVATIRQNERSPLAGVKSLNFLHYIMARREAQDAGCDEAILLNTKDEVAEAATSNIFLVKRGRLITPALSCGILAGITRGRIIAIARKLGISVAERRVKPSELATADEIFLTNSLAEVLPVVRIGKRRIGRGTPGNLTKLLHISYQKLVIRSILH